MDVAVLHHVLHFLDEPSTAIGEVARSLRPGGGLVIVDFAAHNYEAMRTDFAHRWLGFDEGLVTSWCEDALLVDVQSRHMLHQTDSDQAPLTVTIWTATQRSDAPAFYNLDFKAEAS